jgi:hypothetical protein
MAVTFDSVQSFIVTGQNQGFKAFKKKVSEPLITNIATIDIIDR